MKPRTGKRNGITGGTEWKRQTVQRKINPLSGTALADMNGIQKRNAESGHRQPRTEIRMHQMGMADIRRDPLNAFPQEIKTVQFRRPVHVQIFRHDPQRKKTIGERTVLRRGFQYNQRNIMSAPQQFRRQIQHHAFRPSRSEFRQYL